jgi:hypothetical protein
MDWPSTTTLSVKASFPRLFPAASAAEENKSALPNSSVEILDIFMNSSFLFSVRRCVQDTARVAAE